MLSDISSGGQRYWQIVFPIWQYHCPNLKRPESRVECRRRSLGRHHLNGVDVDGASQFATSGLAEFLRDGPVPKPERGLR